VGDGGSGWQVCACFSPLLRDAVPESRRAVRGQTLHAWSWLGWGLWALAGVGMEKDVGACALLLK